MQIKEFELLVKAELEEEDEQMVKEEIKERLREIRIAERVLGKLKKKYMDFSERTIDDMKAYTLSFDRPVSEFENQFVPGLPSFDLSFDITGQSAEWIADSKDILLDYFQSASIRDLLIEINKKIELRK